jgi:hypothetical protein
MEISNWTLYSYCKIGESEVIMSLLYRTVHPTTIYEDIKVNTSVNQNFLILKAIERISQGKGITHKYVCGNSIDYIEHGNNGYTICLENGCEWRIRRPSDYVEANALELFSKKVDQHNQELAAKYL